MNKLKELAAIRFIKQINDENNYYKAEDLIGDHEKAGMAVKILSELGLLEIASLNNDLYYKIKSTSKKQQTKPPFSIESEVSKYKKFHLTTRESLLRQIKLLQSIKSSGEEEKLIELIDKWEEVTREVVRELFNQQAGGGGSLKKFVKKLGINYEELGFDEESGSESEGEQENRDFHNFYNDEEYKRIKYED